MSPCQKTYCNNIYQHDTHLALYVYYSYLNYLDYNKLFGDKHITLYHPVTIGFTHVLLYLLYTLIHKHV